ncbi:MAG: hypothetical protein ABJA89_13765 [Lapillicoccus sp.]
MVLVALLLGACSAAPVTTTPPTTATTGGSGVTTPDTPSTTSPSSAPSATGCPARSTSPGPAGSLVVVGLKAGPTAAAGSTLTVSAQLVVISTGPRIVVTPRGSSVEILRGDTVVGRAAGPAGADVPLPLTAGASYPGQTLPTGVPLVGCDGVVLPPGSYRLRAVVAYGGDPLNAAPGGSGAGSFVLVSDPPLDLTVT